MECALGVTSVNAEALDWMDGLLMRRGGSPLAISLPNVSWEPKNALEYS
jgi:hypothetical protein